ncbi:homolog 4-like [Octopus vulgaris]|uniref:Homolog 4-like n=1 Tax=Octopus vulgaris TaxID=6645 RepID=A0AA36B8D3_OCTVU|nr:homolog 4-like [Octopus vulgaris]
MSLKRAAGSSLLLTPPPPQEEKISLAVPNRPFRAVKGKENIAMERAGKQNVPNENKREDVTFDVILDFPPLPSTNAMVPKGEEGKDMNNRETSKEERSEEDSKGFTSAAKQILDESQEKTVKKKKKDNKGVNTMDGTPYSIHLISQNFGLLQTPATSDESELSDTSASIFNKKPIFMGTKRKQQNLGQREDITPYSEQRLSSSSSDRLKLISPAQTKTSAVKRTPYTSSTTNSDNTAVIAAIVEGRGLAKGEIGMASIDLKCPVLVLSQFSDSQTYVKVMTKLQILQPIEIVIPSTACENGNMSKLFQVISNNFSNCCISTVQRKYFNESKDVTTAKNLELVQNLRDPKSSHSLFGILNYCKTPGGVRLLRANILQPPSGL